jgi:prepilin-type N-terminal cleavage/methylation domain-containing protein
MQKATEKGFTLLEMLAALGILSAIMTVMSVATIMIMKTSSQNEELNVNLRQVQNVGHWVSQDALMAQIVDLDEPGVFLSLSWNDWDGNSFKVDYVLQGNMLKRRLNVNDDPETEMLIAEYIVPEATTCAWDVEENKLTLTIKASLHGNEGKHWIERIYEISPRPVATGG